MENWSKFKLSNGNVYVQYEYITTTGKKFFSISKTLSRCYQKRNDWLKRIIVK